jgi:trimethylamine:corrinoid methyltransferase-like protein
MRTEFFSGNGVTDQNSRDGWIENGEFDARTRAREIAKTILAQKERPYLAPEDEQAIRKKFDIRL